MCRFIVLFFFISCASLKPNHNYLAISFDDVPKHYKKLSLAKIITKQLNQVFVPKVGVFVIGKQVAHNGDKNLIYWAKRGDIIGNHSYSHFSLRRVSVNRYIRDIIKCEKILKKYKNYRYWFRFPYLNEGRKKSKIVRGFLKKRGYSIIPVSIVTLDYKLNNIFKRDLYKIIVSRSKDIEKHKEFVKKLRKIYLWHVDKEIETWANHSNMQILLLHENLLNAVFIKDLIKHLRNKFHIVPIDLLIRDNIIKNEVKLHSFIGKTKNFNKGPQDLIKIELYNKIRKTFKGGIYGKNWNSNGRR